MPPGTEGRGKGRGPTSALGGFMSGGMKPASGGSLAATQVEAEFHRLRKEREARRAALITEGSMQDPGQARSLGGAQNLVGTCQSMCPAFELVEREMQRELDPLEQDGAPAVKIYRRPAAGREVPLPEDVRPPAVLLKTLDYLFHDLLPSDPFHPCFNEIQAFVWNRTRAVRQDFVVQNVHGAEAIVAHERIARYHILILHFRGGLVRQDGQVVEPPANADGTRAENTWSQQQELEQLRKTLRSLVEYYDDARHDRPAIQDRDAPVSVHEGEFRAYQLLLGAYDPEALREVEVLPPPVLAHPTLQAALKIRALIQGCDPAALRRTDTVSLPAHGLAFFARFFSLVARPEIDYLLGCIAEELFADVRRAGLRSLARAMRRKDVPHMEWLAHALGFDDEAQVLDLATQLDVRPMVDDRTGEQRLDLPHAPIPAGKPIKTPFSRALEAKRQGRTCQQIIDQPGTAPPPHAIPAPTSSSIAPPTFAPAFGSQLNGVAPPTAPAEPPKLNPFASSFVPRAPASVPAAVPAAKVPAPAPDLPPAPPKTGAFSMAAAPTAGFNGFSSTFGTQAQNGTAQPVQAPAPPSGSAFASSFPTAFASSATTGPSQPTAPAPLPPLTGVAEPVHKPFTPPATVPTTVPPPISPTRASKPTLAPIVTSPELLKRPQKREPAEEPPLPNNILPAPPRPSAPSQPQALPTIPELGSSKPSTSSNLPPPNGFSFPAKPSGPAPLAAPLAAPKAGPIPSFTVSAPAPAPVPAAPAPKVPQRPSPAQEQEIRSRICGRIYLRLAQAVTKRFAQRAGKVGQIHAAETLRQERLAAALYERLLPAALDGFTQRACSVVAADKYRDARLLSLCFARWRAQLKRKRWEEVLARVDRVREQAGVQRAPTPGPVHREAWSAKQPPEAADDEQLARTFAARRKLRDALWARGQFTLLVYERVGDTADLYADLWPGVTDVLCSFASPDQSQGGAKALSAYLRNALSDDELQIINKDHSLRIRAFPPASPLHVEGSVLMSIVECSPANEQAWADTRARIDALTRHVESQRVPGRWYPKLLVLAWPGRGGEQTTLDRLQPELESWPGGVEQVHIVHLDPSRPSYSRLNSAPQPELLARLFDAGLSHLLRRVQLAPRPPPDQVTVRTVHGFAKPLLVEWRAALLAVQRSYEQLVQLCTTDSLALAAVRQVQTLWLAALHSANLLLTLVLRHSQTLIDEDDVLLPIISISEGGNISDPTPTETLWSLALRTVDAAFQIRAFPGLDLLAAQVHSAYGARMDSPPLPLFRVVDDLLSLALGYLDEHWLRPDPEHDLAREGESTHTQFRNICQHWMQTGSDAVLRLARPAAPATLSKRKRLSMPSEGLVPDHAPPPEPGRRGPGPGPLQERQRESKRPKSEPAVQPSPGLARLQAAMQAARRHLV